MTPVDPKPLMTSEQKLFPPMVAKLIMWAYENGYTLTLGEAYRTIEQAEHDAQVGTGIVRSLHCDRLAIDLNLFRDDVYLTKTEDYLPLGVFWESIGGAWGGRFTKADGNHFSVAYGGRK